MEKIIVRKWDKYSPDLRSYLETAGRSEIRGYADLLESIIKQVLNKDEEYESDCFSIDFETIDHGHYQGTLLFVLHRNTYQPLASEYMYTSVGYGSCSYCDTFESALGHTDYDSDVFSKETVDQLMTLALHLIQNMRYFYGS